MNLNPGQTGSERVILRAKDLSCMVLLGFVTPS